MRHHGLSFIYLQHHQACTGISYQYAQDISGKHYTPKHFSYKAQGDQKITDFTILKTQYSSFSFSQYIHICGAPFRIPLTLTTFPLSYQTQGDQTRTDFIIFKTPVPCRRGMFSTQFMRPCKDGHTTCQHTFISISSPPKWFL